MFERGQEITIKFQGAKLRAVVLGDLDVIDRNTLFANIGYHVCTHPGFDTKTLKFHQSKAFGETVGDLRDNKDNYFVRDRVYVRVTSKFFKSAGS